MIPELQALGLVGLLIHAVKDYVDHSNQGKQYPLKKSIPAYILSILTTSVLIYLKDDIASLYVVTPFSALALGYLGNSVFFSFIKAKTKEVESDKNTDPNTIGPRPDDRTRP